MNFAFPYNLDARGRTAEADTDEHIRQMIEQLLFTMPGERLHRPDFGTRLHGLVFSGNDEHLNAATRTLLQGAIQRWLGSLIRVDGVQLETVEEKILVTVVYTVMLQQRQAVVRLSREVSP